MLFIFDMAGTTVQDRGGLVALHLQLAIRETNFEYSLEEINAVMGEPKPVAIKKLLESRVDQAHRKFVQAMCNHYRKSELVAEIEGASQLFRELQRRGHNVALNTGFSRPIADAIIQRLGWDNIIDDSVTSDEVARGRPYPDMIHDLMGRFGEQPSNIIKIGDTPSDIAEGLAADCGQVIGVAYGSHSAEQLKAAGADAVISSLRFEELDGVLDERIS